MQASAVDLLLTHIGAVIAAVGALGTAAFGLVDATKSFAGGVSNYGFGSIAKTMAILLPGMTPDEAAGASNAEPPTPPALALSSILVTLKSNWMNGMAHDDQVAIAKSLVKLRMDRRLAPRLAALTGVDPDRLLAVADKLVNGDPLSKEEADAYGRFDLLLTTLLDQAYERADQQYRNAAKLAAVFASIVLAVAGARVTGQLHSASQLWQAVFVGLLATPLAPIAKDVANAIQAGAHAVQSWRS